MKKVLFVFTVALAAASVQASYLYWQLDSTVTMKNTGASYTFDGSLDSASASVYVVDGSGNKAAANLGTLNSDGQFVSLGTTEISSAGTYLVDLGSLVGDSYSYYVEYIGFNSTYGDTMVGAGETTSYQALASSIVDYNGTSLTPISQVNIWHGGTANAPEPTSAMMILIGVAGLALKRKQRIV